MSACVYTLFAGVNGVGKTSLYQILCEQDDLGERVNIDEIAGQMGSWRDAFVQIRAARQAMKLIRQYTDAGVPFHQETTMPGPTLIRQVKTARSRGFQIRMYFVGVEGVQTAISRVRRRVEKGGHGIDESIIAKRYEEITEHLPQLLSLCDAVVFYDNTVRFRQIAILHGSHVVDMDSHLPAWFSTRVLPIISDMEQEDKKRKH